MKDLGEEFFVLDVEIHKDKSRGMLRLAQEVYIARVLKTFYMNNCSNWDTSIVKDEKFSECPYPKMNLRKEAIKQIMRLVDIAYAVSVLGRFQSNSGMDHRKVAKKILRHLWHTKDSCLYIAILMILKLSVTLNQLLS